MARLMSPRLGTWPLLFLRLSCLLLLMVLERPHQHLARLGWLSRPMAFHRFWAVHSWLFSSVGKKTRPRIWRQFQTPIWIQLSLTWPLATKNDPDSV